jgi:transcriptional regulator with XRE-family HTH domain
MAKPLDLSERIKSLRQKLGRSQAEMAELLGMTQPAISGYEAEGGDLVPSAEAYIKLGNIAPYPDSLWFWQQAGMDRDAMLSIAGKLLKESGQLAEEDRIAVPRLVGPRKTDREAKPISIDANLVPIPGAVGYWTVESTAYDPARHQAAGFPNYDEGGGYPPIHVPGTVVILDTSSNDATDLQAFWDRVVLLQTTMEGHKMGGPFPGLRIGKLCCATVHPPLGSGEFVPWHPCLRPLDSAALASPFILSDTDLFQNTFGRWSVSMTTDKQRLKAEGQPDIFDARRVRERAKEELRLYKGNMVLGRVIKWYRPPQRGGK